MTNIRINNVTKILCSALIIAGCSKELPAVPSSGATLYEVRCDEPLPQFTLGPNSHPTKAQEAVLCSCIWQSFGDWERDTSEKISQGKESEVSTMHMRAFPSRFGSTLEKCGGMKL